MNVTVQTQIGDEFPFGLNGNITIKRDQNKYYIKQTENKWIPINIMQSYNVFGDMTTNAKILERFGDVRPPVLANKIMRELENNEKEFEIIKKCFY